MTMLKYPAHHNDAESTMFQSAANKQFCNCSDIDYENARHTCCTMMLYMQIILTRKMNFDH